MTMFSNVVLGVDKDRFEEEHRRPPSNRSA